MSYRKIQVASGIDGGGAKGPSSSGSPKVEQRSPNAERRIHRTGKQPNDSIQLPLRLYKLPLVLKSKKVGEGEGRGERQRDALG